MTTAAELDPAPKLGAYAHPERLVTTAWLAEHLDDPILVVAESDEDVLLYETGHIPGAVKIDWHLDLNDPVERDYVSGQGFARLMSSKGISRDTTIVFYGDNFNWWAAYALWVCSLFGHRDVRLLDGGRGEKLLRGSGIGGGGRYDGLSAALDGAEIADDLTYNPLKHFRPPPVVLEAEGKSIRFRRTCCFYYDASNPVEYCSTCPLLRPKKCR